MASEGRKEAVCDTEIPLSAVDLPRNGIIDGIFLSICTTESNVDRTLQWVTILLLQGEWKVICNKWKEQNITLTNPG